jgi:hypothetical protein
MHIDMKIEDCGFEFINIPLKRVKVVFLDNRWNVRYQRVSRFYIDGWIWFTDSLHEEYSDALARAQKLSNNGLRKLHRKSVVIENRENIDIFGNGIYSQEKAAEWMRMQS